MSLTNTSNIPLPPLKVANLTVTRRGPRGSKITVLDDVSLSLEPGECLAIVGASGSGKSVLARTLLGLTDPSAGGNVGGTGWDIQARLLEVTGHDMRRASQRAWRKLRGRSIALVLQDALQSLDPLRTIEDEVGEALFVHKGRVLRSSRSQRTQPGGHTEFGGRRGRSARRAAVIEVLESAGLPDPASLLPLRADALSGGMRQRALIASAMIGDPRVLIADEPTTALDPATARQVLDEFARLSDTGTSLVVVSHDLAAVSRIADRIAVLDGGRIVETGSARQLLARPSHAATRALVEAIPQASSPDLAHTTSFPSSSSQPPRSFQSSTSLQPPTSPTPHALGGPPLASLESATRSFGSRSGRFLGIRDIDLTVSRGEILGIAGGSGEGKTTLARVIAGAERLDSGSLILAPGTRVRLIPQDPLATFDPRWRVRRILEATLKRSTFRAGEAPSPAALMRRVGLSPRLLARKPATLSGGERQRVAIARALAANPDILVADEAVSALDTVTQAGVLALLKSLRDDLGIVFISHDIGMLSTVSDRIAVVQEGRIVSPAETNEFLTDALGGGFLKTN